MTQTQEVVESGTNSVSNHPRARPHLAQYRWQAGQSGNLKGKPRGCKHKLAEHFITALQEDFKLKGQEAIDKVRESRPADYLKIIASIVPKEFTFREEGSTRQATDDELFEKLNAIRHSLLEGIGISDSERADLPKAEEVTDGEPV